MPALVRVENLGPFFNTLAADDKYSSQNMQNFQQQLELHYLKNKRFFLQFLLLFSNLHQIYNLSKKKVSLLVSVFPKLLTPKEVVTWTSKNAFLQNIFRESTLSRVTNTAEINPASLVSYCSMNRK